MKLQHRMEYVKLFWKHDYPDDPVVIIYIKHEIKLDGKFTENSGFYADDRYICAVGFMKKTNSPCIYLFDTLED